jgi:hypothetical protein
MATRVFLHVGTPKSGTTFLQSVWWANKPQLREQGLLLPGTGVHEHYWASCHVRGPRQMQNVPEAGIGAWNRLLVAAERFAGDVLISHELFSPAPTERAATALRELDAVADEVHVVLTARDLLRQVPAEWQQRTKHGRQQTFDEFLTMIQTDESVNFWRVQDIPKVLARWSQGVSEDRVHVVVLPPPGGPRSFLWDRTCDVLGIDGTGMAERAPRANESLGLVEIETFRRMNLELAETGIDKATERVLKDFVAEEVFRSSDPEKIVVPTDLHPWVISRAEMMVESLKSRSYHVVGDLTDLLPVPGPVAGRRDSDVSDAEVARAAVRALALFVGHEVRTRQTRAAERRREEARREARPHRRLRRTFRQLLNRLGRRSIG